MKVIVINSKEKMVYSSTISGSLSSLQDIVGGLITVAHYPDENHVMYVNDEGLFDTSLDLFNYRGAHQPFAGNAVIVGTDDQGNDIDCTLTTDFVAQNTGFISRLALQLRYAIRG